MKQRGAFIFAALNRKKIVRHVEAVAGAGVIDDEFDLSVAAGHGGKDETVTACAAYGFRTPRSADDGVVALVAVKFDVVTVWAETAEGRRKPAVEDVVTLATFGAEHAGTRVDGIIRTRTGDPLQRVHPKTGVQA